MVGSAGVEAPPTEGCVPKGYGDILKFFMEVALNFGALGGALSAVHVHCTRSATIWAFGCSRNPYFVVLWASLLFVSRF